MFRTKKRKVGGRKRRDVELDGESGAAHAAAEVGAVAAAETPASESAESAENDLQLLETLRRGRSRPQSALTFSSKSTRASGGNSSAAVHVETSGLLSFDDGETKKQKKPKMRPNLVASADVGMETEPRDHYSAEMLASLRSAQSVLLPTREAMEEAEVEEEEFIALEGDKTVRIGMKLDKTTEAEELSTEEEESREWEEELMRRGGHRVPPPKAEARRSRDGLSTYPTRKAVVCVSLGSVLGKLDKSVKSIAFEDERASGDFARLEAETALIETTLKQQKVELLASSEEFEYFQEVEDFVKGLSFCLREKVQKIDAKWKKRIEERALRVKSKLQEDQYGIVQTAKFYLDSGILQRADIMNQLDVHSNGNATVNNTQLAACLRKCQEHFTETYEIILYQENDELFADAIDEINSLERVYGRFQEWKAKFPEVYENIYCELAQEKLFAPYVQAELLDWDPLGVADVKTKQGKAWSLDDFAWFRVLNQHLPNSSKCDAVDGPILYQIRNVLLENVRGAVASYFDPYSSLQARSLSLVLEEVSKHGYTPHVEEFVQVLMGIALETFSSEAKRAVLVVLNQSTTTSYKDVHVFANYLLERFNALQDNLLTLFVALPKGAVAADGFRCLLQVLHHLLAYVRHCQETRKLQLVTTATQVVRQLAGSSYLLQILSDPTQEREFNHIMELFSPFLQNAVQ
ncbi:hypothetical protein PHMEG_00011649 [Phytophthora megakarya]|uniref:GCF C-terminal domain-containing protein n=1 Tax=Phytophthora megakarya TaxID=4795 RepID=A0A225WB10_9STRA|nr:hypothetical protein PHMEG_00011649 [Phytophthora megakarya]